MDFREPLKEYEFDTKEHAKAFEVLLNCGGTRLTGKAKSRKSLPKFKGHKNPRFSVFVKAFAMPDAWEIAKLAKDATGYDPCTF